MTTMIQPELCDAIRCANISRYCSFKWNPLDERFFQK